VDAIDLTRQAVALDPKNDDSRIQLCDLLLQQSQASSAAESLGLYSVDVPTLSTQLRLAALSKLAMDSTSPAESAIKIQEAVNLVPWEAKNWLGLAYAETKLQTST
jgi:Tetratricopeptide repeat